MHGNENCAEGDMSDGLESSSNNNPTTFTRPPEEGKGDAADVISENINYHSRNGSGIFPWLNLSGLERFAIAARLGSQRRRGSGSLVLRYTVNDAIFILGPEYLSKVVKSCVAFLPSFYVLCRVAGSEK